MNRSASPRMFDLLFDSFLHGGALRVEVSVDKANTIAMETDVFHISCMTRDL